MKLNKKNLIYNICQLEPKTQNRSPQLNGNYQGKKLFNINPIHLSYNIFITQTIQTSLLNMKTHLKPNFNLIKRLDKTYFRLNFLIKPNFRLSQDFR